MVLDWGLSVVGGMFAYHPQSLEFDSHNWAQWYMPVVPTLGK